jgi:hypothetical protein
MSIFETSWNLSVDELDTLLRKALKCAMLARGINEEALAAELTKRLGRTDSNPVTPGLVNAWKAETKHRWSLPAKVIPTICEILGDDSIRRLLMSEKQRQCLDLGQSVPRLVSLLRKALPEAAERAEGKGRKRPRRAER